MNTKFTIAVLGGVAVILLGLALLDLRNVVVKSKEASRLSLVAEEKGELQDLVQSIKILRKHSGEEIAAFEQLTLGNDNLVSTLDGIEAGGRSLGLEVEIASVDKTENTSNEPAKVSFVVETKGSWGSTLSFLKAVENLPHRVMVDNVYFSKEGTQWRSSIGVALYSFN